MYIGLEAKYIICFFILIPCIIDYAETNQLNALKLYTSLFTYTMAPTCFDKTMPSSGSNYFSFLSHFCQYGRRQVIGHTTEPTYRHAEGTIPSAYIISVHLVAWSLRVISVQLKKRIVSNFCKNPQTNSTKICPVAAMLFHADKT
jgi:hypothetical protein